MDDDNITSFGTAALKARTTQSSTTRMTEAKAIHDDVMNNNLNVEEKLNENEGMEEVEVMRITMSIPAMSTLPLESANTTTTTPEGNKKFLSFCIIM